MSKGEKEEKKGIDYCKHQQGGQEKARGPRIVAGLPYKEVKQNAKAKGKKSRK